MNIDDSILGARLTPTAQVKPGHSFDQRTGRRGHDLLLKMVAMVALASATLEPVSGELIFREATMACNIVTSLSLCY
jgi:hypothetical protein